MSDWLLFLRGEVSLEGGGMGMQPFDVASTPDTF